MKQTIKIISRIIIAVLFIFSGFVKCVDPMGTAIKFEEYFVVFGMDFMIPFSLLLSFLMCGAELLVGLMILLNLRINLAIWTASALMLIYTPLTLWLAISNKVTDCGCFGDAIVLTNWETFIKNIILDVFVVILFLNRKNFKDIFSKKTELFAAIGCAVLVAGFEFYNLSHLPVIDFMPYKIGANIPSQMIIPEGAATDQYKTILYYEKDGKVKKFNLENYPKNDSTWKWADTKSILTKKGYTPPIHDFSILSTDNQDVTDLILSDPGYSLLIIFPSLKKASLKKIDEINQLTERAITKGYNVYGLTSSLPEEFEAFREKAKATYPLYMMDGTTLKTMIRSNPGIMLIKGGTIIGKWHYKQIKKIKDI